MIKQSTISEANKKTAEIQRLQIHIHRLRNDRKRIDLELFVKHSYDCYGGPERDYVPIEIDPNYVTTLLENKVIKLKKEIRDLGIDPDE